MFYGAVFYVGADSNSDAVRYALWFQEMRSGGFGFGDLVKQFYAQESRLQDIYQPLLTFGVSLITGNERFLFAVFGVLFGYAYSRNLWFLIDRIEGGINLLVAALLVAFGLHVSIAWGFNGVRMWTATHVFLLGFLNFSFTRERKYLLVMLSAPLIHFSFWLVCAVTLIYACIRKFGMLVYIFFLASFGLMSLDLAAVQSMIGYLPLPIESRASSYIVAAELNPQIMSDQRASSAWFVRANAVLLAGFFALCVSWMVWRGWLRESGLARSLLVFGMLLYGVVNLVSYIPSLDRFYILAELCILASLIVSASSPKRLTSGDCLFFASISPLLLLNVLLSIRFTLEFASVWVVLGNFFIAPFVEGGASLYTLIFK